MGFWSLFSASDKAVEAAGYAVKKGVDGLDNLFYSDEEQAKDNQDYNKLRLEFGKLALEKTKQAMGETSLQTLSRRYMAWFIVLNSGAMSWAYILAAGLERTKWATPIKEMLTYWQYALGAVVAFYFVTHGIRAFKKT